jgi:uncharacterized protein YbjT (DUF2867 family)
MYHTYMPPSAVLVTGALGRVGGEITRSLLASGTPTRAVDLDPAAVAARYPQVQALRFDFTDPATWSVFDGIRVMFLMRPPALSNIGREMVPALEAARAAGIKHVVLLSLQGADHNRVVPHAKIESWLRGSGLAWTFVRPSFFMENLSGTHASDIRERDCLMVPAGTGATSFVAAEDVAAVAVAALLNPTAHHNAAWTPTGPQALTYEQVCGVLTDVLGRRIRYGRPGAVRYLLHATRTLGMPVPMALVTVAIYSAARFGKASGLTDDVRTVTGLAPKRFEDWAADHKQVWND